MSEKKKKITPMLQQYLKVKDKYPDCLVFFRLGDFYEMFFEDAQVGARELELILTTRDRNKPPEERVPMCGVPHHAVQSYISKLTAKGYKVVICEQMEDPATAVGLVERDVSRIITPGTVLEGDTLREDDNNYLCGVWLELGWVGLAFCDLSTGQTEAMAVRRPQEIPRLYSELESRHPRETVFAKAAWAELKSELEERLKCHCELGEESDFDPEQAAQRMEKQFSRQDGDLTAPEGKEAALRAVGGLLGYLYQTQRREKLPHLTTIAFRHNRVHMELDRATRRNLELTETLREKEKRGSLLWVMDRCKTSMGHRRIRAWLERPLLDAERILARQKAVAELVKDTPLRETLRRILSQIGDLERMVARLGCGNAGARELLALADALTPVPEIKKAIAGSKGAMLQDLCRQLDPLNDLVGELNRAIRRDELPVTIREGGIIAKGYDPQVDHYQDLLENGGRAVLELAERERQRTGIKNMKVKYNKVFGYYLEVTNAYKGEVPPEYIRKQTTVNGERYVSPELKTLEEEILNARELDGQLEYEIFCRLRQMAVDQAPAIQADADAVAQLDVLCGLAALAVEEGYVRPKIDHTKDLVIVDGRHPVVEKTLTDGLFVPNSVELDGDKITLALITGPNMAGKSTYMRQTGLIVLMAQIGSFVPAKSARIGVVDQVFTRIGASDDLAAGQSTFMVEMMEVAHILKTATSRSLLLLDEIGRGTSTHDGESIARAVMEYCADTIRAKTLFATHYRGLTALIPDMPRARAFSVASEKRGDKVVFLRKIVPGTSGKSYGVEVAALAGVPDVVVKRAGDLLREIEMTLDVWAQREKPQKDTDLVVTQGQDGPQTCETWVYEAMVGLKGIVDAQERSGHQQFSQYSDLATFLPKDPDLVVATYATGIPILEQLYNTDVNDLTPMQALRLIAEFKHTMSLTGWKWEL